MSKFFYTLKRKDYVSLIVLIAIGFGWLLVDQFLLSASYQRFIALFLLIVSLYYVQFLINKPSDIKRYANTIALITVLFVVIVSLIMHAIINKDFTYKSILIWIISGALPYLAGYLYLKTKKK